MKKIFRTKNLIFSGVVLCLLAQPAFSKPKQEETVSVQLSSASENPSSNSSTSLTNGTIKLSVQKPTYFSKIDQEIVKNVENGTPASIIAAMQKIRKGEDEYTENERVLIKVATEILKNIWNYDKITWEVPEITWDNSYTGALETAAKGAFDSSTGNTDFLSTLLPAVVVFKSISDSSVYDQSEEALLKALSMNNNSTLANYMLGYLYEKEGKNQLSLTYYQQAYSFTTEIYAVTLAYSRLLRTNGYLEAASSILSTISGYDEDSSFLKQKAYLAYECKNLDAAEEYVGRVLQKNPNDLDFVLFRAKILADKNDYIHAVSLLDVYARQNTSSLDYLLLRTQIQLDWSKNTPAATENVEKALQLYPDNIDALLLAARISSITDAPVAGMFADDLADKILKVQPDNEQAMLYALNGLVQRENWSEAYEISAQIALKDTVSSDFIMTHVQICLELNRKAEAFDYAKQLSDKFPEDEIIQQAYILAYCRTGARDTVKAYLDSQLNSSSITSKMKSYIYYRRSFLQFSEDSQLADLRSSLSSNPRNSDSLFRLYQIYYSRSDYRKAQYYLRQVVAINPNDNSAKQLNEALTKLIK